MTKVTQAHIEARTQDILAAATQTFARNGIDATTMQEIASEAGLSAGAIYRYYPSKEHLLRAVLTDCTRQNQALFDRATASADSPLKVLLGIARTVWESFRAEGAEENGILSKENTILSLESVLAAARKPEELGTELRRMYSAVIEMIEELVRRAQAEGEIDGTLNAKALAVALLAITEGTSMLTLDVVDDLDLEALLDVVIELLSRLGPARR